MFSRPVWISLVLLHSFACFGQVDTEFWFAPPEITSGHGDRPIYLRISTMDKATTVQVRQPARNNVLLASVNIAANTTSTIDLTSHIQNLEPSSPASVQRTGIRVISTAPVTAYYEVGATWNTDIFALKGQNALGNKFVIPAQNYYHNSGEYSPTPYFSFDIVATRNNTVVKIRPTRPLFGHEDEPEIIVKLNAGETYSFRKVSLSALDNPAGTVVESNRPIAITLKDDSVIMMGCRDVLGDQLVPVQVAGSEYVVLKGFLYPDQPEFVFITAIEDNTTVQVTMGGSQFHFPMQAGELHRVQIWYQTMYINASKSVYVMHVTGFGCELGMAILPSITCRGSTQIGFTRTTSEFFGLNVLVRKEGIGNFRLNGSTGLIPATAFTAVPGTNDRWYAAQLSFSTAQVPVNAASLISNTTQSFQIGIINGNQTSSCRYGYFSAFSTLFIGDDFTMCEGETASLDAGTGKESYLWSTGATDQVINITNPGTYWVRTEREDCVLYDTIQVGVKKGKIDLGPDVVVCDDDLAVIDGQENFSWLWSDGSTNRYLITNVPGKYWVSVFDYVGCEASDTIFISFKPRPVVDLGPDVIKCPDEEVVLNATLAGATYLWENGSTAPVRVVKAAGAYWCRVTKDGCSVTDTVAIQNLSGPPQQEIFGSATVCPLVTEVDYTVIESDNVMYEWQVQGGSIVQESGAAIKVNWGTANNNALVGIRVTDNDGCKRDLQFPVRINTRLEPVLPIGPDTLCANLAGNIQYSTSFTNGSLYDWTITGGEISTGQGTSNIRVNWGTGLNTLFVTETSVTTDTVCTGTSEMLKVYVYEDPSAVSIAYITVDPDNESFIDVHWTIEHPERVDTNTVEIFKRESGRTWALIASLPADENSLYNGGNMTDAYTYDYAVRFTNLCVQNVMSIPHTTMRLTGALDEDKEHIHLAWSQYEGWPAGVDHYEIWKKLDGDTEYSYLASVAAGQTNYAVTSLTAFDHRYIIRAVEKDGPSVSYSNSVSFSVEHEVFVPNIFTPDGDGYNPYFEIRNIGLFKDCHLQVFNRWGKRVFEAKGYDNTWDGGGQESGVYYYWLNLNRNGKVLKGSITIVR